MVAPRRTKKIFCTVVRVAVADDSSMKANNRIAKDRRIHNNALTSGSRPSDLLPWADPYIARLVTKLQDEVRTERGGTRMASRFAGTCLAELEPPSPTIDSDWEGQDEPRWFMHDET